MSEERRLVFRYHLGIQLLVWALFVIPVGGITVLLFFNPPTKPGDEIAVTFLYLLFGGLSVPLLWEMTWWRLELTDDGLRCRSPWRGWWTIAWDDVERLDWSAPMMWFVIAAKRGWWFRFSYAIGGRDDLLRAFEKRLMAEQMNGAEAGYQYIGRAWPHRRPVPGVAVAVPEARGPVQGIDLSKWGDRRR